VAIADRVTQERSRRWGCDFEYVAGEFAGIGNWVLYMGTLAAVRYNPVIKAFYERLLSQGKVKKVALVACMHKLLRILNAMIRDGKPWQVSEIQPERVVAEGV
jgi:hypothetical protein